MERSLFDKYSHLVPSKRDSTDWENMIYSCSKITKMSYIVTKKRIESVFKDEKERRILSLVNRWIAEAGKHENPGMILNARMKQYKLSLKGT